MQTDSYCELLSFLRARVMFGLGKGNSAVEISWDHFGALIIMFQGFGAHALGHESTNDMFIVFRCFSIMFRIVHGQRNLICRGLWSCLTSGGSFWTSRGLGIVFSEKNRDARLI